MRSTIFWGFTIAISLSLPSLAQTSQTAVPIIGETIDVRVVNVEAVITNAAGERVRGLAAGDFRLLVDGKEVPVEYFAEIADGTSVKAENAPVATGEEGARNYLVYIDEAFLLPALRQRGGEGRNLSGVHRRSVLPRRPPQQRAGEGGARPLPARARGPHGDP